MFSQIGLWMRGLCRNPLSWAPVLAALLNVSPSAHAQGRETYEGLRDLALKVSPADLNLRFSEGNVIVYGLVMDTGYAKATVTLVSFVSGDASLYFSTGGGIIGGIGHKNVVDAVKTFVATAQTSLQRMTKVTGTPLPATGRTRFYAITTAGIYATPETSEDALGGGGHELSPLFFAGQDVISAIRMSQSQAR